MPYVQFHAEDVTTAGSPTPTRQSVITAVRDSLMALRDDVLMGRAVGWSYSQTGADSALPATETYANGTERIRDTHTYDGTVATRRTSTLSEYSSNSGSSWVTIGTFTCTFDSSSNVTGGNTGGAVWRTLNTLLSRLLNLVATYGTHAAATGTSVHGLGTISTQAANNVAITGGAIDNTPIGATTPARGAFKLVDETHVSLGAISGGGTATLDWSAGGSFNIVPAGAVTVVFSNVPAAGRRATIVLEIVNGAGKAITLPSGGTWGAVGAPTLGTGTDLITITTRDGGATSRFVLSSKE